ncbi:Vomp family autotransporter [Bartonella gliris]|uniref:Vomp family autotransporter n=1 Tax=Bartonella gliris TaxID=3004109 RepID=UPI00295E2B1A|nr:Vomp family autotransporter [Bartonella gliris]
MKKFYTTLARNDVKSLLSPYPLSLVKGVSFAAMVAFLSNVSLSFAANLDLSKVILKSVKKTAVASPQSVISVYNTYNSGLDASRTLTESYLTALNMGVMPRVRVNASNDYVNFLINTLLGKSNDNPIMNFLVSDGKSLSQRTLDAGEQYKRSLVGPRLFVPISEQALVSYNDPTSLSATLITSAEALQPNNVSDTLQNGSIANLLRSPEMQRDVSESSVVFGNGIKEKTVESVVIGNKAQALLASSDQDKSLASSVVIGSKSQIHRGGSVAVGADITALNSDVVAVGRYVQVEENAGTALGFRAQTKVSGGVALGSNSYSNRAAGKFGYAPSLVGEVATNDGSQWKSTLGAVSVGDVGNKKTRQITGVAAGSEATDAVNVTQLRDLKRFVRKNGWKLSVGDKNATTVLMDGDVDFSAGSNNLNITKGDKDNKLKFDLAKDVMLSSAKVGGNTLDATGLVITGGPKIMTDGIGAGSKKITGLAEGTDGTDAVNKAQLDQDVTDLSEKIEDVRSVAVLYDEEDTEEVSALTRSARKVNKKSVTFGDPKEGPVALHNVADGKIAKDSHDAVNGSQLFATNQNVTTVTADLKKGAETISKYFGGGASYKDGEWTQPDFKVNTFKDDGSTVESTYHTVAEALAGVGTSFTHIKNEINKEITNVKSDSLVKQEQDTDPITIGKETEGTIINLQNKNNENRALSGVMGGKISKDSIEAVNGSQLHALGDKVATYFGGNASYENGEWTAPTFTVKTVKEDGKTEDKDYHNVAAALEGVGTSFTNIQNEITKNNTEVSENMKQNALLWSQSDNAFVAQHGAEGTEKTNSKIKFLANGDITEDSTDAITGGQLYSMGGKVLKYLGGGAKYENGTWTDPSFKVKTVKDDGVSEETVYTDVASALTGVGTSLTNVQNKLTEQVNNVVNKLESESFVQQDKTTHLLTIGAAAEGGEINIANKDKGDRILSGVKAATQKNEAVNKGQLDESLEKLSNSLQSDESAVVHYDKTGDENSTINYKSVTLGGKDKDPVGLHNVADGAIAKDSHDAINGSQLHSLGTEVAKSLGGNAKYENGTWTAPTYEISNVSEDGAVTENSYNDVGSAFAGLDTSVKNVNTHLANEVKKFDEKITKITQEVQGDALLWSETDKAFVAKHGKEEKVSSKITSLQAGDITSSSTDAVNGSQLYSMGEEVAKYLGGDASFDSGSFTAPTYKLSQVDADGQVTPTEFKDVGKTFEGLDTSIQNVNQRIKEVSQGVAQDSLSWSKEKQAFVAQHGEGDTKANSKITFLQNGNITEDSTDAVNGSQLYSMGEKVAKYFGGDAKYEDGAWTAPSFKLKTINSDGTPGEEKSYDNVAEAFADVGTSFTNIKNDITNVISDSLVKQDTETKVIKIGSEKDGTKITVVNSDGAARTLTGISAGTLSEGSTDAVNGSQLYSVSNALSTYLGGGTKYENGDWAAPSFKVRKLDDDGNASEETYNNVAEAFDGVSSSFTKLHNKVNNEINKVVADNLVKWDEETKVIKIGGEKDGSEITLINSGGKARTLSGVMAGILSESSTEAVNGSQLYSMSNALAAYFGGGAGYSDGKWSAPEFKVAQFKSDGSSDEKKSYNDVASAFDGVSESMTSINGRIQDVEKNVSSNSLNWNEEQGSYDASHKGEASKITNVLDGKIAENSQEVVNGGQLWTTNEKVKKVEERVDTLDQHVKDIASVVTDGAVNYDKDADGKKTNKITLAGGDPGEPVMIDNVADGRIEKDSKEAINGGQLRDFTKEQMKIVLDDAKKYTDERVNNSINNAIDQANQYTDIKFEALSYDIESVRKEARQAAAIGLAVANLRYYDTPGSLSVGLGSGIWRGQSAIAFGAGYTSEDGNIRSNLSVTSSRGHIGMGAGIILKLR